MSDLQTNLAGQQGELDDARTAEAQRTRPSARPGCASRPSKSSIATIKDELRQVAVQAYIDGGSTPQISDAFDATNLDDMVRQSYLRLEASRHIGLADQLRAAKRTWPPHAKMRRPTRHSQRRSEPRSSNESAKWKPLADSRPRSWPTFETRLDQRLSEAASLNVLDQQLSNQIAAQEAAIAARLPKGGGSGGSSAPIGNIPLTTVRGSPSRSSIAGQLDRMLAAAQADGLTFGGSGYRDSSAQWELRKQNCPDPANSPPSACHPPTARAGASMHERGLAIDFTYSGRVIGSHDDPGYQWLGANAGRFDSRTCRASRGTGASTGNSPCVRTGRRESRT